MLTEALGDKMSLELSDFTIRTMFLLEYETASNNIANAWQGVNKVPGPSFLDRRQLLKDGLVPFVAFRAKHCFME